MKKYLSLILALVLIFALAVPAMASGLPDGGSVDITADYIPGDVSAPEVYSVTLEWATGGTIAYNAGGTTYSWNSSSLAYDTAVKAGEWMVEDARIDFTVKNRSNRPVDVEFSTPTAVSGVDITGSYDHSTLQLGTAATGGYTGTGTEQLGTAAYTITDVSGKISSSGVIATIAVKIIGK